MPLYEYECTRCRHRFEKLQRFSDPPADECPACGGPVSQLLSAPAIQFKGSGWYVTDYAKRNSSPAATGSGNGKANGSGASAAESAQPSSAAGSQAGSPTTSSADKK